MSSEAISHEQFAHLVNTEGGASRNFDTLETPKSGVMVSIPGAEKITKAPLTKDQASRYKKDHDVMATGKDYHGAWEHSGNIFQDVSRKHDNLDSARKAGERDKQIAGYDVGGTDLRRPGGGEVSFNRNVTHKGNESDPEFLTSAHETSVPERMSARPRTSSMDFAEQAHISRAATVGKRGGGTRKVSINEVYAKIAKNRRNRGV